MADFDADEKRARVIMPTAEDLVEMEAEGNQRSKIRGRIEMVIGVLVFVIGILLTKSGFQYANKSIVFAGTILAGITYFGVGVSRQFKP